LTQSIRQRITGTACTCGLGRHEQAIAEAERANELDPLSRIISNLRAAVLYDARQYDRAIEAARKTLELDKGFSAAPFSLGLALEQKKMYPEAIAALQEAVALGRSCLGCEVSGPAAPHRVSVMTLDV